MNIFQFYSLGVILWSIFGFLVLSLWHFGSALQDVFSFWTEIAGVHSWVAISTCLFFCTKLKAQRPSSRLWFLFLLVQKASACGSTIPLKIILNIIGGDAMPQSDIQDSEHSSLNISRKYTFLSLYLFLCVSIYLKGKFSWVYTWFCFSLCFFLFYIIGLYLRTISKSYRIIELEIISFQSIMTNSESLLPISLIVMR